MSHAATPSDLHAHAAHGPDFSPANVDPPAAARTVSRWLLLVGAICLVGVAVAGVIVPEGGLKHALAAYHIGVMAALAICLGATFWVMAFHLTQAGWSSTIRRQFENVMRLTPVLGLMVLVTVLIEILNDGVLFVWMDPAVQLDPLRVAKGWWFSPLVFVLRSLIYVGAWSFLSWRLWTYSTEQDRTGDKWLTNRARFTSAWGMLVFALTVAFASFDWLMSLDYRFFSTMWGVYFFAGAAYSSVPVVVLLLAWNRSQGKLEGLVTREHLHDLAKLMFGFTVFWAYIAFSQYFLIWYANIPEETQFMTVRKVGFWRGVSIALVIGHFILPFYCLLWLFIRRSFKLLAIFAFLAVAMEVVDLWWIVRPFVYAESIGPYQAAITQGLSAGDALGLDRWWIDATGIFGVLFLFAGLLFRQVGSGPLIPTRDPRLPEALHHRNYV